MNVTRRRRGLDKLADEGRCRMCLRSNDVRRLTRHHLIPLRYSNGIHQLRDNSPHRKATRWCDENIVPLCRPCHDLIENPTPFRKLARMQLRRLLTRDESEYVAWVMGSGWLRVEYPRMGRDSDLTGLLEVISL